jgi:hypothetical protein
MVYFQTKNPNLGKFWRVLQLNFLVHIMDIWYIVWAFGIFWNQFEYFAVFLVYFPQFWYVAPRKSGNTVGDHTWRDNETMQMSGKSFFRQNFESFRLDEILCFRLLCLEAEPRS